MMPRPRGLSYLRLLAVPACLCLAHALAAAGSADLSPIDKIRSVYAKTEAPGNENVGDPSNALVRTVLAPAVLALWRENAKCWDEDGEGEQMWVWGQDVKLSDLRIATIKQSDDETVVEARFKNFDDPQNWKYVFHRHAGTWLADDVLREDQSIVKAMAAGCQQ